MPDLLSNTPINAEVQYLRALRYIYEHGVDLPNPRTGIDCRTVINVDMTYDATSNRAPILTTRKMNPAAAISELLGYLKGFTSAAQFLKLGNKTWDCLPTSTKILTRRGVLSVDEVEVGDETVGYNQYTGRSEWTPIKKIMRYEDADLVRVGNSTYGYHCTPNHRWLTTLPGPLGYHNPHSPTAFVCAEDLPKVRANLLLAAPLECEKGLNITTEEASLLGWIAGDGYVEKFVDAPGGRKSPSMTVCQTKTEHFEHIEKSLSGQQYYIYDKERDSVIDRTWRLSPEASDNLKARAGHPKEDAVAIVRSMSSEQRLAWLTAILRAEGHGKTIYQTVGPVLDAIRLAVYLNGWRPGGYLLTGKEQWKECHGVTLCRPSMSYNKRAITPAGKGEVWCVTTGSGSWTAVEDGNYFLTGNSNANENAAWLANPNRKGEDDLGQIYGAVAKNWPVSGGGSIDLIEKVYNNLRAGKDDRGEIIAFWNPGMFHLGALRPCLYEHQFSLLGDDLYLNSTQRSADFPLGTTFNMIQCWLLLRLMAQITGKNPKFAYHRNVNSHIYSNQLDQVPKQLAREPMQSAPTIDINPDIRTLQDVIEWATPADFSIVIPETHPPIKYPFAV